LYRDDAKDMPAMGRVDTASEVLSASGERVSPLLPHLFVVLSGDRPLGGGARHALDRVDEVTVGRGESRSANRRTEAGLRHLALMLPGRQLSGTHARMLRVGTRWTLEDCQSTNGVLVNGERVERAVLADGDIIELGRTVLLYREAVATPPETPQDLDTRDLAHSPAGFATLVPALARDHAALANVARSDLPLLLLGETGTGKEVLARAVHAMSGRAGPLVPVNCGAIPESLMEGQLFGHVRGAFSGAVRDEVGLVRAADGGTLFLDEIGDLPATSQAALLRVLQEGEVQPVGATRPIKVRVRALAATHRPLAQLAEDGRFRSDLYARLNGYTHDVPPLRDRLEDLPLLLAAILPRIAPSGGEGVTLAGGAVRGMIRYRWSLNVRELQLTLARAVVLAQGERIDASHLSREIVAGAAIQSKADEITDEERREEALRRELIGLLEAHDGNVSEVARTMGKARMQIHRWMKRFALEPKRRK
jgi:transcriptional regulator with GAF, ATPase, and Fis domain